MSDSVLTKIHKIVRHILIAMGVIACLYLFLFVKAPDEIQTDRTVVAYWNVVGAQEVGPPAPGWFNESQDEIFVKRVGVPFLEIEKKISNQHCWQLCSGSF